MTPAIATTRASSLTASDTESASKPVPDGWNDVARNLATFAKTEDPDPPK